MDVSKVRLDSEHGTHVSKLGSNELHEEAVVSMVDVVLDVVELLVVVTQGKVTHDSHSCANDLHIWLLVEVGVDVIVDVIVDVVFVAVVVVVVVVEVQGTLIQPISVSTNELHDQDADDVEVDVVHGAGTHSSKLRAYELHGHEEEEVVEVQGAETHVSKLGTYELHGHDADEVVEVVEVVEVQGTETHSSKLRTYELHGHEVVVHGTETQLSKLAMYELHGQVLVEVTLRLEDVHDAGIHSSKLAT